MTDLIALLMYAIGMLGIICIAELILKLSGDNEEDCEEDYEDEEEAC